MLTRRNFLASIVAVTGGFKIEKDTLHHEASDAFLTIYKIMILDDWYKKPILIGVVQEMTIRAGFSLNMVNVLIDYKSKPMRTVTIFPNGEVEYMRNGKSTFYKNADEAIFGIYGIQNIL